MGTMEINGWKTQYDLLKEYINKNTEIIINKEEISIPAGVREEFYRLFDEVRKAVVAELFSTLPVDVETLSVQYGQVEKEILELFKLDSISMPVDLYSFLHHPKQGMERVLYTRLFDVLQNKTTLDVFEQSARNDFKTVSVDLYRLGYEYWAALSLIKMLEPDKAFKVELDYNCRPFLAELKSIAFGGQAHHPTIRLPEFVIHSCKLDKYLAVKMALTREIENYQNSYTVPVRPKRPTGDTSMAMESRSMILSFVSNPEEIPIIAEVYDKKIISPDLIIEFVAAAELEDSNFIYDINRRLEILRPKLGACLLVMDVEGKGKEAIADGICAFKVGFDPSNLNSVTALMA
jgi:hypothetical protein